MVEMIVEETPTAATEPMPEGELRWLPLDSLCESQWNPRQSYSEHETQALVESMRASGYREWLPLMVRPLVNGLYEIGAGHRRSRAARIAGIAEVPCVVREMSDEQFLDVLNFDNSGRSDVHPLHEAAGWAQWMEKTGKGVLDIAARIGQSKEYVYQRLKYGALIPEAKQSFLNGQITGAHAILIARLQPNEQMIALQFAVKDNWQGVRPSVRDLASFIQRDVHLDLDLAAFDLASMDLLPHAGSCDACPKRTKNSPDLLTEPPKEGDPADDCTDPGCFNAKVSAHLVQIEKQYEAAGMKLLKISRTWGKLKKGSGADYGASDFQEVPQDAKGSLPALWIDGQYIGKLISIKLHEKRESSTATAAGVADDEDAPAEVFNGRGTSVADQQRQEKRQAAIKKEVEVRRAILEAVRLKVKDVSRVDIEILLRDILHNTGDEVEIERIFGDCLKGCLRGISALEPGLAKLRDIDIYQLAVISPLLGDLDEYNILEADADNLLAAAKRYKVDAQKIRKDIEKPPAPAKEQPPKKIAVPKPTKKANQPVAAKKKKAAAPKPIAKKKAK